MLHKLLTFKLLLLSILLISPSLNAQEVDLAEGETLFKNYCASCHNKNMRDNLTGPALGEAENNWADYPREELYLWIRNSQLMISEGHPRAVELWNEWKPTVMTSFPALTDAQIENILGYISDVYNRVDVTLTPGVGSPTQQEAPDNTWLFVGIFAVLAVLAVVLARIISNLNYMAKVNEGGTPPARKTLVEILTSRGVIGFVLFLLIVLGLFSTVDSAINLGRQQGYEPTQPIKFSHATHAGLHQIDCQYCHDGARRSKHSVIPAANTCMNCHRAIKKGSEYGTAELTKIYASIGYDPSADKYIEDYESMSESEIKEIYEKWITDQYIVDNGGLDAEGEYQIEQQWKGIVESLTNPTKKQIQGPIEWVRIHNLPDHVYFNHAQHVTVGEVECQTCHGKVEEMEVVAQHSPLSMGWCVNCHRQTDVKFAGNEYYDTYELYHDELANGNRTSVKVEEIGGLECQKCHY